MNRITLLLAAASLLAACSGSKNEQRGSSATTTMSAATGCPADVPGTTVRAEDTGDGVAMVFTTSDPQNVTELRRSVASLARDIETGASSNAGGEVRTGMPGDTGSMDAGASGSMGSGETSGTMTGEAGTMEGSSGTMGESAGMGTGASGTGMMGGVMALPQAQADLSSIDGGSRLELTPTDPAQLDQLRSRVRQHVQAMQSGSCPMHGDMHGKMQGNG